MPSFASTDNRPLETPTNRPGSSSTIRVFLADDHPAARRGLRGAIEEEKDMCVCGEASTSKQGIRQIEGMAPDVAVLDISLADARSADLLENLQASVPETKTVIYSMEGEQNYDRRAVDAGASAYLEKSDPIGKTIEEIRTVAKGRAP